MPGVADDKPSNSGAGRDTRQRAISPRREGTQDTCENPYTVRTAGMTRNNAILKRAVIAPPSLFIAEARLTTKEVSEHRAEMGILLCKRIHKSSNIKGYSWLTK